MSSLELRSQLYAWLGNRTSQADGDAHDHESLTPLVRDLAELVEGCAQPTDLNADSIGKFVRIFPGWDTQRLAPMVEGEVIAYIDSPSVVVRDRNGHTQAWPVTLPIEEMS